MFLNMLCYRAFCLWNQIKLSRRIQTLVPNIIHWKENAIFPDASRYIVSSSHHAISPVFLLYLCPGSKNVAKTRPARDALDDRCHASHLFPYSNRLLGLDNYSGQVCSLPFSFPLHLTYYIIFPPKKSKKKKEIPRLHKMNIDICTHNRTESITFDFTVRLYSNSAKCFKMLTMDVSSNPKKRRILDLLLFTITASIQIILQKSISILIYIETQLYRIIYLN